ncbi:SpoIIE family protein phosphatase [Desulfuromonas acetoxidans]|uniref:PAS/PAC sensor protein n=1 Tax=Desulfuromonas acetoxidans (strain DSM 684 / 11070) TaxID=281689 RepID=Q1JWV6_DESA6|nr:SpoIIE family protein phosphatase [Desulfuromonas acetoxidans]EAT14688.1 putative PAS/PAC sensor protein [Desulfuromonas acetoxidans DSM 684]MBF0646314.1 PAS domain S-box protein [Desulfuromonas acetoxidans]NVD25123.1 PAS domain S-box protein [Desulfuromonas acetoxidans]NVE17256.1 PAS domain S-box protein [Desulfuromonas acetoxidans]
MEITRAFLSSIINSSDDAILGMRLDGRIISWNEAAEKIYGYRREQILHKHLWQLCLPERHDEIRQLLNSVIKGQRVSHFHTMHLRRDGQSIFVSLSISPLVDDVGQCVGAALISRDITRQWHEQQALEEAREKYQQIFHRESDAIILLDAKRRTVSEVNDAACRLYGYSQEDFLNQTFNDLLVDSEQGKIDLARCLCGEGDVIPASRHRRRDGSTFTAEVSISSILCGGHRTLVAIIRDISERQKTQALRHSLAMAREIQRKLLPRVEACQAPVDLYVSSRYCDEIGGDFYDFFLPDEQHPLLSFAVGDVSGHGAGAALLMAMVKGVFRLSIEQLSCDLQRLFSVINRHLVEHSQDDSFMTLFCGQYHPQTSRLVWNSAGHGPVFWYRSRSETIEELATTGYPLGINAEARYVPAEEIILASGDILLIGTDGIWEARNSDGEMFGTERLRQVLASHVEKSARSIHQKIMAHLDQFMGTARQEDDISLMVVKFLPEHPLVRQREG